MPIAASPWQSLSRGSPFEVVYLARHGETEWNRRGRRQGQLDSPLTVRGKSQADAVAGVLEGCRVDAIFHSPLGRAAQTAQIIATRLHATPTELTEPAEVHHGDVAGLTGDEIDTRFPGMMAARDRDKFLWRFPGGESYADADARATSALAAIAATSVRRPLLVSHEMIGQMLLRQLARLDPAAALATSQPNNVVVAIEPTTGCCSRLIAVDTTAHL